MHRVSLIMTALLAAAGLAACGGGSSGSPAISIPQAPQAVVFSGVAATGAPMPGARIDVYDHSGSSVCTTTAAIDGHYSCELPSGAVAPFVLTALLDDVSLVSAYAKAETTTLNVTPITNLIAARLASNGDPAQLRHDVVANAGAVTAAKLDDKVAEFIAAVEPLLTAVGDRINPLTGEFKADGSGHDLVLDSLQISIRPAGGSANVEVTAKVKPSAPEAPPISISFNTADTTIQPMTASMSGADLVGTGVADLVADLAARLDACYALTLSERVQNGALVAPACTSLFLGNDPTTYLQDGLRVGPGAAFAGLFSDDGTGVTFDRPRFEDLTSEGDVVATLRWTAVAGNSDFVVLQARRVGSQLMLVGNQAVYSAVISPTVNFRGFVNSPAFDYRATGYTIAVGNRLDAHGQPVFAKVEVTAPNGDVFTLKPSPGLSYLALTRNNGSLSTTATLTLAARFTNSSTPGNPADKDTDPVFVGTQFTEDELIALPDHGVWKIEYFYADGVTPNLTQYVRTLTRALSMDEAMVQPIVAVTDTTKAALVQAGYPGWGAIFFNAAPSADAPNWVRFSDPSGGDFWVVPDGALAPYQVATYGSSPLPAGGGSRVTFNDYLNVPSNVRQATVKCSAQSTQDTHCDPSMRDSYAMGAYLSALQLLSHNQRQLRISNLTALWTLQ